jgi:hypothetical protein
MELDKSYKEHNRRKEASWCAEKIYVKW